MENQIAIFSLEIGAAILFWLVIVVLETAAFQLMGFGVFQRCLRAALLVNLVSGLVVAAALMLIRSFGFASLLVGLLISILLEGLALNRLQPDSKRLNWIIVGVANLASFVILIFPIYFYAL